MDSKQIKYLVMYLAWLLFASLEGMREAAFFAHGGYLTEWPYNIHLWFLPVRGFVLSLLVGVAFVMDSKRLWLMPVALWLCFSFWHDGFYYETRSALDFPAYNFFSFSTTTTAQISAGPWLRIAGQLISLVMYTILILSNKKPTSAK